MTSRRDALIKLLKGAAVTGSGGLLWGTTAKAASSEDLALRPPGALHKTNFIKACIACGQCVDACPYDTLKLANPLDNKVTGTPYMLPRDVPCYMCTDYPCITACPSGALREAELQKEEDTSPSINNAKMGVAVVHKESCIAFWGIQCDACYRACPLMGEAITLVVDKNQVTGKHANMKPVIQSDVCTGCGKCEHACVVDKAAIFILPRKHATGKVGDHYIKGWEKEDEQRIRNIDPAINKNDDVESALDYLNDDEEF